MNNKRRKIKTINIFMNFLDKLGFSRWGSSDAKKDNKKEEKKNTKQFGFTDKYTRKDGEKRIYNLIILDESGSMSRIESEALNGANMTIDAIRKAQTENPEDNQMLCFVTFDSNADRDPVRIIIDCEKIQDAYNITSGQYKPCGMTPLLDAIGMSVTSLRKLVRECDNVLVTVITDGMENSSCNYNPGQIKELTESLSQNNWVFNYIGANQDSESSASSLGFSGAMDFEASDRGAFMLWSRLQSSSREYYKKVRRERMSGIKENYTSDFFSQKNAEQRVTPEYIKALNPDEIFVFGSNIQGNHDGGASRLAVEKFGAVMGQGTGLQGQSYAIPTMSGINEMKHYIDEFIQFADCHPEMKFMVTRIGCGTAGYAPEVIAPMFAGAYSLPNVYLPEDFWMVLTYKYSR